MSARLRLWVGALLLVLLPASAAAQRFNFHRYADRPAEWFASAEARRIADNLLLYQHETGGWPKNRIMTLTPAEEAARRQVPDDETKPTFDNDATHSQLQFLARVIAAGSGGPQHTAAFLRGLDYSLDAQYPNGGWPQYYPLQRGYYSLITFNDDAMAGVLEVLHGVANGAPPFAFVDEERRVRARGAVERGIACILRCQVVQDGRRTIWGAQHDVDTYAPAPARAFEPASLTAGESVGILRFLMGLEEPSPEVIAAVEDAVAWLRAHAVEGVRWEFSPDEDGSGGFDRRAIADPTAPLRWARFYELGTNRPIFAGRDGVVRYDVNEIEKERRTRYAWYVDAPAALLKHDYPAWKRRLAAFSVANAERRLTPDYPQIRRPVAPLPADAIVHEGIVYSQPDGRALALDVYRIPAAQPSPALIIVHGGGWETGSREMERPLARALAARGYVAVPISYRLGPAGRFPAALHDVKAAVAWLRAHAAGHGVDSARIGLVGASAGGQLVALAGCTNGREEFAAPGLSAAESVVQLVVNLDGLADFTDAALVASQEQSPSAPVRFLGGKFSEVPETWRAASALTHAGPRSAPLLSVQSTAPTPLLPGREALQAVLQGHGVAAETVVLPDTPHPFWLFEPWFGRVVDEIDRFARLQFAR